LSKKPSSTARQKEKVVLISVIPRGVTDEQAAEYLDELSFLAETAGADTLKKFTQKLSRPDPKYYVGSGKLNQITAFIKDQKVSIAIFDDELTAGQIRNLEKALQCRVMDRTNLILDIFARRAQTAQARTQVELAQYQYLLPRLTRMWTHLEKQRGGIGLRGPGETEIETDRRVIRDKLARLKDKLDKIDKQNQTRRKQRHDIVRVALVGYTNVGKSTLMNMLSKSKVFAENKLFATLDTTVRKLVWDNIPFLMSDTVGFIRKLPHKLVESFKSTLDELKESDILIHVVDISHPNFEEHINVVNTTLAELDARDKPIIMVFNKIDAYRHVEKDADDLTPVSKENLTISDWKNSWMAKGDTPAIFISATKKQNIQELKDVLLKKVKAVHMRMYPQNKK
jgi:GTPase